MMRISDKLINDLTFFGLTGNESKAFLALLQLRSATAHEIAKIADIPRQEVYRVLPNLEKLGVVEVIIDKPTRYTAVDPSCALTKLIQLQQERFKTQLNELIEKKTATTIDLKAIEGKSARVTRSEPIRFMLISGQNLINETIEDMLRKAKTEVLWMAPKNEFRRAVGYGTGELLRNAAKRGLKARVITEVDEKNVDEVEKLNRFCNVKHLDGITSIVTIVDDNELIMGSAMHSDENIIGTELVHELWTNDSCHISLMKEFFEKIWNVSVAADIGIQAVKGGRQVKSFSIIQGKKIIELRLHEMVRSAKTKLFIVSYLSLEGCELMKSLLEDIQKENIQTRLAAIIDEQNKEMVLNVAKKVSLHVMKEKPVSFLLTDSECIFSSTSLLQIPNEVIWSANQNTVNMFWVLAEEIWNTPSEEIAK